MTLREQQERIWFNPSKFWGATKDMAPEQADRLFESVQQLAAARKLEELRRYDFISVGNGYLHPGAGQ